MPFRPFRHTLNSPHSKKIFCCVKQQFFSAENKNITKMIFLEYFHEKWLIVLCMISARVYTIL